MREYASEKETQQPRGRMAASTSFDYPPEGQEGLQDLGVILSFSLSSAVIQKMQIDGVDCAESLAVVVVAV